MLPPPGPALVASRTSGVDGSSEGGRLSTTRLPYTLVLYGVALIEEAKRRGYKGKLAAEPALVDGHRVLKLIYDGEPPKDLPSVWMGHRVIFEKAPPPPPPPAPKSA
jgi:hypothetical protein